MEAVNWKKTGKTVNANGTTITYRAEETRIVIESRLRHIPHANGIGTWDHTVYVVIGEDGYERKVLNRLADAKEYARLLLREGKAMRAQSRR